MYTLDDIRHAWVQAMLAEWRQPVIDFQSGMEPTPNRIQPYFEASATGRWVLSEYTPDGMYCEKWRDKPWQSWCGLILGYTGQRIGDFLEEGQCVDMALDQRVVDHLTPGTNRLFSKAKWQEHGLTPPDHPPVLSARAGDILAVGEGRDGDHLVMVREDKEAFADTIPTIEGNATGLLGNGKEGEGVIKSNVHKDDVRQTYRLYHPDYLTGEATSRIQR